MKALLLLSSPLAWCCVEAAERRPSDVVSVLQDKMKTEVHKHSRMKQSQKPAALGDFWNAFKSDVLDAKNDAVEAAKKNFEKMNQEAEERDQARKDLLAIKEKEIKKPDNTMGIFQPAKSSDPGKQIEKDVQAAQKAYIEKKMALKGPTPAPFDFKSINWTSGTFPPFKWKNPFPKATEAAKSSVEKYMGAAQKYADQKRREESIIMKGVDKLAEAAGVAKKVKPPPPLPMDGEYAAMRKTMGDLAYDKLRKFAPTPTDDFNLEYRLELAAINDMSVANDLVLLADAYDRKRFAAGWKNLLKNKYWQNEENMEIISAMIKSYADILTKDIWNENAVLDDLKNNREFIQNISKLDISPVMWFHGLCEKLISYAHLEATILVKLREVDKDFQGNAVCELVNAALNIVIPLPLGNVCKKSLKAATKEVETRKTGLIWGGDISKELNSVIAMAEAGGVTTTTTTTDWESYYYFWKRGKTTATTSTPWDRYYLFWKRGKNTTTTTTTTMTETTTTTGKPRAGGAPGNVEGLGDKYLFRLNDGNDRTGENETNMTYYHFQVGGEKYFPNLTFAAEMQKEYETYQRWEAEETQKAQELTGAMEADDAAIKAKFQEAWDPAKYLDDMMKIRDELLQSRLFNDGAEAALEEWMKKRTSAEAAAATATKAEEAAAATLESVRKRLASEEERQKINLAKIAESEDDELVDLKAEKKAIEQLISETKKIYDTDALPAYTKAEKEKLKRVTEAESIESDLEKVLQKVCKRMGNEAAKVANKVVQQSKTVAERKQLQIALSEEKTKMELTCSKIDKLITVKVSQKNKLEAANEAKELEERKKWAADREAKKKALLAGDPSADDEAEQLRKEYAERTGAAEEEAAGKRAEMQAKVQKLQNAANDARAKLEEKMKEEETAAQKAKEEQDYNLTVARDAQIKDTIDMIKQEAVMEGKSVFTTDDLMLKRAEEQKEEQARLESFLKVRAAKAQDQTQAVVQKKKGKKTCSGPEKQADEAALAGFYHPYPPAGSSNEPYHKMFFYPDSDPKDPMFPDGVIEVRCQGCSDIALNKKLEKTESEELECQKEGIIFTYKVDPQFMDDFAKPGATGCHYVLWQILEKIAAEGFEMSTFEPSAKNSDFFDKPFLTTKTDPQIVKVLQAIQDCSPCSAKYWEHLDTFVEKDDLVLMHDGRLAIAPATMERKDQLVLKIGKVSAVSHSKDPSDRIALLQSVGSQCFVREALSGRASLKFKLERSMAKPKFNILLRARNRATRGGVNPVFQMTLNRKCNPTIVKDFATLLLAGGDPGVTMVSTPDGYASAALGLKAGAWSETHLLAFDVPRHSVKKFPSVPTPQKGFEKDPDCRGPLMDGDVVYSQAFWDFERRLDNDDLLNAFRDEGWDDQSRMCPPPDKTRKYANFWLHVNKGHPLDTTNLNLSSMDADKALLGTREGLKIGKVVQLNPYPASKQFDVRLAMYVGLTTSSLPWKAWEPKIDIHHVILKDIQEDYHRPIFWGSQTPQRKKRREMCVKTGSCPEPCICEVPPTCEDPPCKPPPGCEGYVDVPPVITVTPVRPPPVGPPPDDDVPCGELEVSPYFLDLRVKLKLGGCVKAGDAASDFVDAILAVNECLEVTVKTEPAEEDCEEVHLKCETQWTDVSAKLAIIVGLLETPPEDCDAKGKDFDFFREKLKVIKGEWEKTPTNSDKPFKWNDETGTEDDGSLSECDPDELKFKIETGLNILKETEGKEFESEMYREDQIELMVTIEMLIDELAECTPPPLDPPDIIERLKIIWGRLKGPPDSNVTIEERKNITGNYSIKNGSGFNFTIIEKNETGGGDDSSGPESNITPFVTPNFTLPKDIPSATTPGWMNIAVGTEGTYSRSGMNIMPGAIMPRKQPPDWYKESNSFEIGNITKANWSDSTDSDSGFDISDSSKKPNISGILANLSKPKRSLKIKFGKGTGGGFGIKGRMRMRSVVSWAKAEESALDLSGLDGSKVEVFAYHTLDDQVFGMVERLRMFVKIIATEAISKYAYIKDLDAMFVKIAWHVKRQLNAAWGRKFHVQVGNSLSAAGQAAAAGKSVSGKIKKDSWYYFRIGDIYFAVESCGAECYQCKVCVKCTACPS